MSDPSCEYGHSFNSLGVCWQCGVDAPPIPEFLRRQSPDPRDAKLDALKQEIAKKVMFLSCTNACASSAWVPHNQEHAPCNCERADILKLCEVG